MSKVIRWVSYFAILVSPLLMIDVGNDPISMLRETIKVLLILFVVYVYFAKKRILCRLPIGRPNFYSLCFFLGWGVYAIISLLWSPNRSRGMDHIYYLALVTFFAIWFSMFFNRKAHFITAFWCFQIAFFVQSLLGWYEILFRHYFYLTDASKIPEYSSHRMPVGQMENPNNFALMMLLGIFIGYICYQCRRTKWEGVFSLIAMINCCVLLLKTDSRAALIGLGMGAAFFVIIVLKPKPKYLVILGCAAVVIALLIPSIRNNLLSLFVFNFHANNLNSNSIRLNLILNGFYILGRTVGFGAGAGGIESWMTSFTPYPLGGITNMHNWWMEVLTEFGVLIFLAYLLFFIKLFRDLYKNMQHTTDPIIKAICMGLLCCMVSFIVGSIGPSSLMPFPWLWVFWAVAIAFQGLLPPVSAKTPSLTIE